ncbi:hypothetical protein K2173_022716 [Erythroxylum novogranatense]|uniref:Uncharacterized protein n=1 Tax=Erythroxylum novogranatense TaxID=1862640 RepID=A0AAV8TNS8_9ROSI|nr:hypothetical protein K2173_022716 [Erythroxylum novogranatense]
MDKYVPNMKVICNYTSNLIILFLICSCFRVVSQVKYPSLVDLRCLLLDQVAQLLGALSRISFLVPYLVSEHDIGHYMLKVKTAIESILRSCHMTYCQALLISSKTTIVMMLVVHGRRMVLVITGVRSSVTRLLSTADPKIQKTRLLRHIPHS